MIARPVARALGVDQVITGHACSMVAPIQGVTQSMVWVNMIPAATIGDPIAPHTIKVGKFCVGHTAVVNMGSSMVTAMRQPLSRIGDSADLGAIITGSPTVFCGGIGTQFGFIPLSETGGTVG